MHLMNSKESISYFIKWKVHKNTVLFASHIFVSGNSRHSCKETKYRAEWDEWYSDIT